MKKEQLYNKCIFQWPNHHSYPTPLLDYIRTLLYNPPLTCTVRPTHLCPCPTHLCQTVVAVDDHHFQQLACIALIWVPGVRGQHLGQGRDFVHMKNLICGHHIHASKSKEQTDSPVHLKTDSNVISTVEPVYWGQVIRQPPVYSNQPPGLNDTK